MPITRNGAEETLKQCISFAPPDRINIKRGGCVSACGNGPVLIENEKIVHKRVNVVVPLFAKVLDVEGGDLLVPKDFVEG